MRWIMKLQEYRFTVEHKPGAVHGDADGVSRLAQRVAAVLPQSAGGATERSSAESTQRTVRRELNSWADQVRPDGLTYAAAREAAVDQYWAHTGLVAPAMRKPTVTARRVQEDARRERNLSESRANILKYYLGTSSPSLESMRQQQQEDDECRYLSDYLVTGSAGNPSTPEEWRRVRWALKEIRHLELQDGILYRRDPVGERGERDDRLRVYVPREARWAMMTAFHDHFGHHSQYPMRRALQLRHYWPGMGSDVQEYVGQCHECTLGHRPALRNRRPKGPRLGHYPFDLLYVDVLDLAPTHDYVTGEAGYSKLLVFVDSLTRWVEAVPFNGDPSSEQVLDAFMTHIVARHGCPRCMRSDLGSNLASDLCDEIMKQTGCNLRPSTAEHHESVGTVERFNDTISQMIRVADEGGMHWADHLPFLLMSYRATPHRITQLSPAALLYGRELRLPAQIDRPDTDALRVECESLPEGVYSPEITDYALRLHDSCVWAWHAASEASLGEQAVTISRDTARAATHEFAVGDRVARLLPDRANKLKYLWSGPYRIAEVLPDGRYKLRDLENRIMSDEFDAMQLRRYRTVVDAEELAADEYVIDRLDWHRDRRGQREYRVKWRGFPMSQSTWEPRAEIERRAASLVEEYERALATSDSNAPAAAGGSGKGRRLRRRPRAPAPAPSASPDAAAAPAADSPSSGAPVPQPHYESDDLPSLARFERGEWMYGIWQATPRGRRMRWYPAAHFAADAASNDSHFATLRQSWLTTASDSDAEVVVAAVGMRHDRRG
jgi:hypothetical protein